MNSPIHWRLQSLTFTAMVTTTVTQQLRTLTSWGALRTVRAFRRVWQRRRCTDSLAFFTESLQNGQSALVTDSGDKMDVDRQFFCYINQKQATKNKTDNK